MLLPPMALSDSRILLPTLQILVVLLFQFSCILIPLASPLSFNFSGRCLNKLHYQKDAYFDGEVIQLTKNQGDSSTSSLEWSVGRATYPEPVPFYDDASVIDFSTCFLFKMGNFSRNASADGLAFFLSPYPSEIPENSSGGTLGLFGTFGASEARNNTVVAIEFDSHKNVEYNDSSNHHVGIDVHTIFSVAHVDLQASFRQEVVNACVCYNASTKNLSVSLRNTSDATRYWSISHVVDLREVLPDKGAIGFAAATGGETQSHRITSWSFSSTDLGLTNLSHSSYKALASAIGAGVAACGGLGFVCVFRYRRCKKGSTATERAEMVIDSLIDDAFQRSGGPRRFPYGVLASATKDFTEEGKLGEGGFGGVYKGLLMHGSNLEVAVKRISRGSKQGAKEYISEVTIISRLRHRNLVQLVGYCHEKNDLLLVYEYMPNKSLDYHLYHKKELLAWPERYKIALGLASALLYLHEEWEQCVVHRDVKPSNVMLDSEFNAKLGDFGLAKLVDHDSDSATTVLAGTRGYMAPEYALTGKACKESDVYSFGVVILEIACGRKPIALKFGEMDLVKWVWELYGKGMHLNAADERLKMEFDEQQMECLLIVGLWCTHLDYELRPSIRQAINVLKFDAPLPTLSPNMPLSVFLRAPPVDISNLYSSHPSVPNSIKSEC